MRTVQCFGGEKSRTKIITTREKLATALRYIAKDRYRRERMYAMIEFHSMWHMLEDESGVASWLLWELDDSFSHSRDRVSLSHNFKP